MSGFGTGPGAPWRPWRAPPEQEKGLPVEGSPWLGRASGNNAAASLLEVAPHPYRQEMYVTCLDLGAWGAMYSEGWDREVKMVKDEAKQLKSQINSAWIYPPAADRAQALAAADPSIPVAA